MGNKFRLSEIASMIGAVLVGDDAEIDSIAAIEEALPGQITFLSNLKYAARVRDTKASAVIAKDPTPGAGCAFLLAPNPYYAFARTVELFHPQERPEPGVSPMAVVHTGATLGQDVSIGPFAVVENEAVVGDRAILMAGVYVGKGVSVGEDSLIYPRVTLYHGVRVGKRSILHSGCVIGSDGFGFAPSEKGFQKIPQVGIVEIDDDVEIGANTTIDRATLGVTRIGRGTKLDNLIQVGHNVTIGGNTVIASQAGISGSCKVGSRVMIGGQVGLAGHIEIGDDVMLGAKSGVGSSLSAKDSQVWSGIPAIPHKTWLRVAMLMSSLPELFRRVKRLETSKSASEEE